jgi:hypothetical protein
MSGAPNSAGPGNDGRYPVFFFGKGLDERGKAGTIYIVTGGQEELRQGDKMIDAADGNAALGSLVRGILDEEPKIARPSTRCHLCGEPFSTEAPVRMVGNDGLSTVALLCDGCAQGLDLLPEWDEEGECGDDCEGCEYETCEGCGLPEDDEPWDGFLSDAEADADALAGAGWGCDEDYGFCEEF